MSYRRQHKSSSNTCTSIWLTTSTNPRATTMDCLERVVLQGAHLLAEQKSVTPSGRRIKMRMIPINNHAR